MEINPNVVLTINYTAEDLHKLITENSMLLSIMESGKYPTVRKQQQIFMNTLTKLEGE